MNKTTHFQKGKGKAAKPHCGLKKGDQTTTTTKAKVTCNRCRRMLGLKTKTETRTTAGVMADLRRAANTLTGLRHKGNEVGLTENQLIRQARYDERVHNLLDELDELV